MNIVDFNVVIKNNSFVNLEVNGKPYEEVGSRNYLYQSNGAVVSGGYVA